MAVTDVVRPVSVLKAGAGTSVPSGTLAAVTSDNSDATYIDFNLVSTGSNWSLRVGSHTPSAGYQRHRVRGRIRIRADTGTLFEDIDLGRGALDYIGYDTITATSAFTDQSGSWYQDSGYGLATVGALADLNIGGGWLELASGSPTESRTAECYVDIDCRFRPDYSPEVQDNAGVDQSGGTVTDTNQPVMAFGSVVYDGLPALDWTVTVKNAALVTVFSATGSGTPPSQVPVDTGLDDGSYTAAFSVRSTIRGADPFEYAETLAFDIQNIIPPPSPPLVEVTQEFGGYRVTWTDPGGQAWDNDYVVAEVWRDDCTGSSRIAVVPDALNGSYLDLAIPQLDPLPGGVDCEVSSEPCDITYRVRYQGYVSTFVELPDAIPADMILGWPGTVGTIPSGWSRVTALDAFYPRGSNGTGVPTGVTGGVASHSHTTPGHAHSIAAHNHTIGGSTGTSNASTTSARFNGASQPQADQPHSHSLPSSSGTAAASTSGSNTPATSVVNNVPLTRDVIWVKSDGAQTSYAVGLLGFATESVSGWVDDASSAGRFLKGAAAAGNGGAQTGAATHTHTVNLHTHTGTTHDHSVSSTGLSNPSSSQEAGYGSSSPRWLPRHTHPLNILSDTTGSTGNVGGGTTGSASLDPPNRRLRVLRNTGGGIQTRIIGLYVGTVAAIDPLMTLCDGAGGTPDMRTYFARDFGSDSVNSTGGASTHTHTTVGHTHGIGNHDHSIDVLTSTTGSFEAPSSGDLGDSPTTTHDHSGGSTDTENPAVGSSTSGTTGSASTLPPYKEVHFVRLDGTIAGGPLAVPELKISDFASATVPSFTYTDDLDRLSSFTDRMAVSSDRSHEFPRLVVDSIPLQGGLHSISTTLSGEDMTLTMAVVGLPAINRLEALLANDRVYWSPLGGTPGWFAPMGWTVRAPAPTVKVVQVTMVRQPWPTTPEPEEFL
jgi:hypothetical protein